MLQHESNYINKIFVDKMFIGTFKDFIKTNYGYKLINVDINLAYVDIVTKTSLTKVSICGESWKEYNLTLCGHKETFIQSNTINFAEAFVYENLKTRPINWGNLHVN